MEKTNKERAHNANKLEDANATINSLQHALSQARTDVAILSAEKNEAGAKHEMETSALNAKLAKCLEELDKSHGNLQRHSTEHHGYLEKLSTLVMDDSMMSLMAEEFGKKVSTLRDMSLTVKGMHEHLAAMGFQIDPIMEVKCFYGCMIFPKSISLIYLFRVLQYIYYLSNRLVF